MHVETAIAEFAAALGIETTLRRYAVLTRWKEIVGEQIAKVTEVQRLENGILFVNVKTAPWRAELSMKRMEIVGKLNAAVGAGTVREIRFH